MTRLKAFNMAFQWTGFRLARIVSLDTGAQTQWGIVGPVLPLTGWWGPYVGTPRVRLAWPV